MYSWISLAQLIARAPRMQIDMLEMLPFKFNYILKSKTSFSQSTLVQSSFGNYPVVHN